MKKLLLIFMSLSLSAMAQTPVDPVIPATQGWKFIPQDNMVFAQPEYVDTAWNSIGVDKPWEDQGYDGHDGYSWYRLRVVIPSSLRQESFLKDSLRIFLGKIDDYDQTYLNGILIGCNGINVPAGATADPAFMKASPIPWDLDRRYTLAVDNPAIFWDRDNVIAVRVYDQGGPGGIYSGHQEISMTRISDYFSFEQAGHPFEFTNTGLTKNIVAQNISGHITINGKLMITAKGAVSGNEVLHLDTTVSILPGGQFSRSCSLPFRDEAINISCIFRFRDAPGVAVENDQAPYLLTPPEKEIPRINGALVTSAKPGHPFLYKIAATGKGKLTYTVTGLPDGLQLDPVHGIISGSVAKAGDYKVEMAVTNLSGKDKKTLVVKIGDALSLTPPMGWNSWNCWGLSVDMNKVTGSAHAFVEKGLQSHGWCYINIDDGWEIPENREPKRDQTGNILTNEKFPDMKALGDSIHHLGLKFGIYSSPGPLTCGHYTASYQHEVQDANSWAGWGIDYLKYDWCSYEKIAKDTSLAERQKPYFIMRDALKQVNRDIVLSLCQYGMGNVWEWGKDAGGNLWRTTGDITDSWESMSGIGFNQVQDAPFAGPGHWNDPDMLVLGRVGWGPSLHQTGLTPDEQYTHISLWCMLSAPLLLGCDLSALDPFTLNLLTNDEVLAIDQDPLGKQAVPVMKTDDIQVWVKQLADGSKAIGIFNLSESLSEFTLRPEIAGIPDKSVLRDLWRQKELAVKDGGWNFRVPAHGVVLVASCKL